MASLNNKSLFFTTSPRTPSKMIPEIRLLCENFSGKSWNKKSQTEYIDLLAKTDFFEGGGSEKNKDFSARDRINRGPKALGFVDLSPHIGLTDAGKAFVYGSRPQEAFLRQLLKFQLPSPYHVEKKAVRSVRAECDMFGLPSKQQTTGGVFYIRPYLEMMRLVRELGSLTFDELKIFGLTMTDYRKFDSVKQAILDFRAEKESHRGRYKEFVNEKWVETLLRIYSEDIETGNTKTRETTDRGLKKFLNTKKSNSRDYADACFRYLRYTGLISISHKNRSISFYSDRINEVDFILSNVDRTPIFVDDETKYKAYLFDAATPVLYTDNVDNIIDHIMQISDFSRQDLEGKELEELKDIRDTVVQANKESAIREQVTEIKSYSLYSAIIDTFNDIVSDSYYDAPLMLEYNTWRAMTMLDGGNIKGNFKFDDAGQPLSTAQGNMPDIECDYNDFVLSVEVTMQTGQRQYESEGEPVARHFGQLKKRTGKETYCLFIAPAINNACLAHFYALNKIGISYYGGKTKIIPLDMATFVRLVENSYKYPSHPTPNNIRQLLDGMLEQEDLAVDENDWNCRIHDYAANWLIA